MTATSREKDKYLTSQHKLHWHLDRVTDWSKGKSIVPLYIDMGITQTCNIHCQYCYYATPENRTTKIITTENLIKFLNDAAEIGVKAIGFLGDGEPTLHPGCFDAVIAGANAGLDMAISTNGAILNEKNLEKFLQSLTYIRFNISAASPETYSRVMGTAPKIFDKVTKNVSKCVEIKKKFGMKTTIGMQMVLVEECVNQIVPYAKLGKELGVDYVQIKQCSEHGTIKHGIIPKDYTVYEKLFKEAETHATKDFSVIIKRIKMNNKVRSYNTCYGCNFLPQIDGAGDVYPCGNWFGSKDFLIGNINKQSFKDIVYSKRYEEIQQKVTKEVNVHKQCGIGCRQNEINEYLWDLKNPPDHINFI
jgi:radical SAM protein with 4Fe4S-binding SPASM domain